MDKHPLVANVEWHATVVVALIALVGLTLWFIPSTDWSLFHALIYAALSYKAFTDLARAHNLVAGYGVWADLERLISLRNGTETGSVPFHLAPVFGRGWTTKFLMTIWLGGALGIVLLTILLMLMYKEMGWKFNGLVLVILSVAITGLVGSMYVWFFADRYRLWYLPSPAHLSNYLIKARGLSATDAALVQQEAEEQGFFLVNSGGG